MNSLPLRPVDVAVFLALDLEVYVLYVLEVVDARDDRPKLLGATDPLRDAMTYRL